MVKRCMLALAVAVLACLPSRLTGASGVETPVAPEQEARPSEVAPAPGPQVGIEAHGHWTIEIRNPNGTLAERREFENAYVGGDFLPRRLGRSQVVGLYSISFRGGSPLSTFFFITEASGNLLPPAVPATGPNLAKLVLSGGITYTGNPISISDVTTSISPNTTFTEATLNPVVAL